MYLQLLLGKTEKLSCSQFIKEFEAKLGQPTNNFLNFAGKLCCRCGMWRSPSTRTSWKEKHQAVQRANSGLIW